MKKIISVFFVVLLLGVTQFAALAQEELGIPGEYGTLKIFTKVPGSHIYVDGKFVGEDSIVIDVIEAGLHQVKVEKAGEVYFSKVVEIKMYETVTVVAQRQPVKEAEKKPGAPKAEIRKAKEKRTKLSPYLSIIRTLYDETGSGSQLIGERVGIGICARAPLWGPLDLEGGFTYYAEGKEGTGAIQRAINLHPIYSNIIVNLSPNFFLGGGINYTFWTLEGLSPTGYIGYQAVGGFRVGNIIINIGWLVQKGDYKSAGSTFNMDGQSGFINGGVEFDL